MRNRYWHFDVGDWRFGVEKSRVGFGDTPYLDRYIVYAGKLTFRMHKFWRGDDDRAPHDHPWTFVTFPLSSYEEIYVDNGVLMHRWVPALRFNYRSLDFKHIVIGRKDRRPFWTFVITGPKRKSWGFWPSDKEYVPWRLWR